MSEVVYRESADRAWAQRLPHAPARYAAGVLALAGLYYAGAKTGYLLEFSGPVAAIVWLPVGVGIAFLYLGGIAYWPGVLIGDLLANNYMVLPLGSALGQTCGNVLEVLISTMLLRRLVRHGSPLGSVRGVGAIAVSIAAGAAVSATVGATSLLSGGVIDFGALPTVWRTWWRCSSCRLPSRGTHRCRRAGHARAGSRPARCCWELWGSRISPHGARPRSRTSSSRC
jgi:integral membrane sensor domain MASE1